MASDPSLPYRSPKTPQRIPIGAKILLLLAWIFLTAPPILAGKIYGEDLKFQMIEWANRLTPLLSWPVASKVVIVGPWLAIASIAIPLAFLARRATVHLSTPAARLFRFATWALISLTIIILLMIAFVFSFIV